MAWRQLKSGIASLKELVLDGIDMAEFGTEADVANLSDVRLVNDFDERLTPVDSLILLKPPRRKDSYSSSVHLGRLNFQRFGTTIDIGRLK